MYLIVSLYSVFVDNHWKPIKIFIDNECPYVMKSGFECLKMSSFSYAASGVRFHHRVVSPPLHLVYSNKIDLNGILDKLYSRDFEFQLQQRALQQKGKQGRVLIYYREVK